MSQTEKTTENKIKPPYKLIAMLAVSTLLFAVFWIINLFNCKKHNNIKGKLCCRASNFGAL